MADNELLELMHRSPLAGGLDDGQVARLAARMKLRQLADEEVLFREGDVDHSLYLLAHGRLEVTRGTGDDDWVSLHVLRPGDMTGEMGFVDGEAHSATLRALGPVRVLQLVRDDFERLLDEDPHLVYTVMRSILRTVHGIVRRMNVQFLELSNYISKQHGRY